MRRIGGLLFICSAVIVSFSTQQIHATTTTVGSVSVTYHAGLPPGAWSSVRPPATAPACSSGGTTQCGYLYTATGNGWNSLNSSYGWHAYGGSGAQSFLNTLTSGTGLAITLTAGVSDLQNQSIFGQYYAPTNDNGYYMYTSDSAPTGTPGITFDFSSSGPGYISKFAFYWGSVDPWNTIIFTDNNGGTETVSGADLNYSTYANNTYSMVSEFEPAIGATFLGFQKVQFLSCTSNLLGATCQPAFEFDNIEWFIPGPSANGAGTQRTPSPVPEPAGLFLLGTGVAGIAGWLRRRIHS